MQPSGYGNLSDGRLDATFAALADPTRRAILARLAAGEASVTELARPFAMSQPAISKHLKVLERAGLIARGREAQWRPCRLNAARLKEIAGRLMSNGAARSVTETSPSASRARIARLVGSASAANVASRFLDMLPS